MGFMEGLIAQLRFVYHNNIDKIYTHILNYPELIKEYQINGIVLHSCVILALLIILSGLRKLRKVEFSDEELQNAIHFTWIITVIGWCVTCTQIYYVLLYSLAPHIVLINHIAQVSQR